jgi:hypothetical protein
MSEHDHDHPHSAPASPYHKSERGLLPVVKRPFFVFQDLGPGLCLDDFVFNWWEELTTGLPTGIVR